MTDVVDAIGQRFSSTESPRRVVSLVPSETLSVYDLVGLEVLVGRTDYCIEPAGTIEAIPSIGGTKSFDVPAVQALKPDLVLANKEENGKGQVQALIEAGLRVHVSFPCSVEESLLYLRDLCLLLGLNPDVAEPIHALKRLVSKLEDPPSSDPLPVFVPIWKDPWMTFDERVYASDVLRLCGAYNVFSGRSRRYPLAADLGSRPAMTGDRTADRDTRYPRIRLEEVPERGARAALLPDEPYAFTEEDAVDLRRLESTPPLHVELVNGGDLFWYGTHLGVAAARLSARVQELKRLTQIR